MNLHELPNLRPTPISTPSESNSLTYLKLTFETTSCGSIFLQEEKIQFGIMVAKQPFIGSASLDNNSYSFSTSLTQLLSTYQPPLIAVFRHEGIPGGQQRLHSLVEPLVEPERASLFRNARAATARPPGVLQQLFELLRNVVHKVFGVPGDRDRIVRVVEQEGGDGDDKK